MADEERAEPPNKRRRPPTTIDVKATEVASDASAASEPVDPAPESAPTEEAAAASEPAAAASPVDQAPPDDGRGRFGGVNWRMMGAGLAGLAILAALLALWLGAFRGDDPNAARLARLEQQLRDLANRPQPPAADPRAVAELSARVAATEQAAGRLSDLDARIAKAESAAAAPRTAAPDQAVAGLRESIDGATAAAREAKSRADAAFEAAQKTPVQAPSVAPADMQALAARVTALEQAAKALEQKTAATAGAERAARPALRAGGPRP